MKFMPKGKRILSLLLAFALLLTMLPPMEMLVYSTESDQPQELADPYAQYIGWHAHFTDVEMEEYFLALDSKPELSWAESSIAYLPSEFSSGVTFVITDYKVLHDTYSDFDENGEIRELVQSTLWYQVDIIDGSGPEANEEEGIVAFEDGYWILQNYLNEEDAYEFDVLSLFKPQYSDPVKSIVSESGITVSSISAELTDLLVEPSTYVPTAHFVTNYVSYQLNPKTDDGSYTDWATVTLPIPDGWDSSKVFGFVAEPDGSMSVIPGDVTDHGTFRFTVPHFSEVGVMEVAETSDVKNVTITFGPIHRETHVFRFDGHQGTEGKYLSADGKVEYVVNYATVSNVDYTYITFCGLDVTDRTIITVGGLQILAIVEQATAEVDKLLAGTGNAASATLYPMYDLGFTGDFEITYALTSGMDCVTLDTTNAKITSKNIEGTATVVTTIKHRTSGSIVGAVTYNITTTTAAVTDVKNIYVPTGGTVNISVLTGDLSNAISSDPNVATVSYDAEKGILSILGGENENTETTVIAGSTLLRVYVEPENPDMNITTYIWFTINKNDHCTVYYAINGGELHCLPSGSSSSTSRAILVGLDIDTTQEFPDPFSIIFFGAPDPGYITSNIAAPNTQGQYYALANGWRYDGSDSDAWPMVEQDTLVLGTQKIDKDGKGHGLYGPLRIGNLSVADMRNLFTRALALGCDSVCTYNRENNGASVKSTLEFYGEAVPRFEKTITQFERKNDAGNNEIFPYTGQVLKMGDVVTYQFKVTIPSQYISYQFTLRDTTTGLTGKTFNHSVEVDNDGKLTNTTTGDYYVEGTNYVYTLTHTYTIGGEMADGKFDINEVMKYADGKFVNTAELIYEYQSAAAHSKTETTVMASATADIGGVITWKDNFGKAWQVTVGQDTILPVDPTPDERTGYIFNGWQEGKDSLVGNGLNKNLDGTYTVDFSKNSSVTILGTYLLVDYNLTFVLDGGMLPADISNPTTYNIETALKLPTPAKQGYKFDGWEVTSADGNWTLGAAYSGEKTLPHMYGDVTLTAKWTEDETEYTVTWKDWDGTVLDTDKVRIGTMPVYSGNTPTRISDDSSRIYEFVGWTPTLEPIIGNVTYMAVYSDSTAKYSVTFVDFDGRVLQEAAWYDYGTVWDSISKPADPTRGDSVQYTYTFAGWKPAFDKLTKNVVCKATYTQTASTTTLTIKVEGCNEVLDPKQSFVLNVTSNDGANIKVTVYKSKDYQVTICGLTPGNQYTVTMENEWSWRYDSSPDKIKAQKDTDALTTASSIKLILEAEEVVTFTVNRTNDQWLDGNDYHPDN